MWLYYLAVVLFGGDTIFLESPGYPKMMCIVAKYTCRVGHVKLARTAYMHRILGDFPVKMPCIHHIYRVLANPIHVALTG